MKLVLLTPGTGNFHCGSCLHDEALAKALRQAGHDASIVGLYLPLVLDDPNEADAAAIETDDVQMGGVNLYLQQKSALFRSAPAFIDRLLDSPGLLRKASNRADMTSPHELGRMTVEMLHGEHGKTAKELRRLINHLQDHGKPEVVLLNNALLLSLAQPLKQALGCAVACTLQGEDTFLDDLPEPYRAQAWEMIADAAKCADVLIGVSQYHADLMQHRLGLPAGKVRVVHNGIDAASYAPAPTPAVPPTVGYLARLTRTKGVFTLIEAFTRLAESDNQTQLLLVGAATPNDRAQLNATLDALPAPLHSRIEVRTNVTRDEKLALLQRMTLLCVPATYGESFGLYTLEANATGIPAVLPNHAGHPEVIAATGGGILYNHEDTNALPTALEHLLADEPQRMALGQAGRAAVHDRFTAAHMAQRTLDVLETICPAPSS